MEYPNFYFMSTIKCPTCSYSIPSINSSLTRVIVCPECCSTHKKNNEKWVPYDNVPAEFRSILPLTIGQQAVLKNERYTIIGWSFFESIDDSGIHWEEWLLISEAHDLRYLSYSPNEGAIFLKKIPHRQDEEPRVGTYISTISGKAKIYEKVSAQILDFVGELDWEPTVHGISTYFSAQQNDFYYSLEKHNVENTELYGGYIIEPDLLEEAFDIQLSKSFFQYLKSFFKN